MVNSVSFCSDKKKSEREKWEGVIGVNDKFASFGFPPLFDSGVYK